MACGRGNSWHVSRSGVSCVAEIAARGLFFRPNYSFASCRLRSAVCSDEDSRWRRRARGGDCCQVRSFIQDPAVSAAVILFTDRPSLEVLARAMLELGGRPGWTVTPSPLENNAVGNMIALRVARAIPFGDTFCPSEALVLGPFAEFPPTRRAPIAAFEIYVGVPREFDPKTGDPTTKANLAHMEMNLPTHAAFENMWSISIAGRLKSLGDKEDNRAKAKITLVIPLPLAQQLGCA